MSFQDYAIDVEPDGRIVGVELLRRAFHDGCGCRASLDELLRGDVALNLHRSNAEMEIYTACVDLR